jgi:hypothetical protein
LSGQIGEVIPMNEDLLKKLLQLPAAERVEMAYAPKISADCR